MIHDFAPDRFRRSCLALATFGALAVLPGCPVDSNADIGQETDTMTTASTTMTTTATNGTEADSSSSGSAETNIGPVDFSTDVLPILTETCTMDTVGTACHTPTGTWSFFDLTEGMAYMSLLEGDPTESILPYVTPSDPDQSYVLNKLKAMPGTIPEMGSGVPMPQQPPGEDFVPLPAGDIAIIEAWIEQGAPE